MPVFTKDGRAVLFIHVPKTGGTALEKHFVRAGWEMSYHDGRMGKGELNHYRRCTPQHMHGSMLQEHFLLGRFDAVFAVVRDPIARFRSEFAMRNRHEMTTSAAAVERWAAETFDRYASNPFVHDNHIRPQAEFVVPETTVFRFEQGLDAVARELNERFGLDLAEKVSRVRTSERASGVPSRAVELTPGLESRLLDFYAEDFHRFGYRDVPAPRPSLAARLLGRASRELAHLARRF